MHDDNDDFLCRAADDIMTGLAAAVPIVGIIFAVMMLIGPALTAIPARAVVAWICG